MMPNKATGKEILECSVGEPIELKLDVSTAASEEQGTSPKRSSGVMALEVHPSQIPCNLGGIRFKNYYTGFLTVKVKIKMEDDTGSTKDGCVWKTCIHRHQLMPNSHCETGSQDYFTIMQNEMLFQPRNVMVVRLILQQPSPVWISFKVEEISLLADTAGEEKSDSSVMEWLHQQGDYAVEDDSKEASKDSTAKQVAEHMHKMWALTETMKISQQTQSSLGRFDVDGSYEINLLSYT